MSDTDRPADGGESFFSRWSRRKSEVRSPPPAPSSPTRVPPAALPDAAAGTPAVAGTTPVGMAGAQASDATESPAETAPRLTLDDVEKLTAESDFSAFANRDVDPAVRNAAMKKLFHADPHFNVMDGLDVYIDDYNTPDPLPKAIMRTMLQARALGLLDDELKDQDKPEPDAPMTSIAQAHTPAPHENTDLQLQPDHAGGSAGPATGPASRSAGEPDEPPQPDPSRSG